MAMSADQSMKPMAEAVTQLLRELGAKKAPDIAVPGSARLNRNSARLETRLDTLLHDQRDIAAQVLREGSQRLHHHISKASPDCVGCEHARVAVEHFDDHIRATRVVRMSASCSMNTCRHDVKVIMHEPGGWSIPGDPSASMARSYVVTTSDANAMELRRQVEERGMRASIDEDLVRVMSAPPVPYVPPRSKDKPLTGESEAW